jgi:beta-lactam-binding protein with PASTA domain
MSFFFAAILTLLVIVALAIVGVSILVVAFTPRRIDRPAVPRLDREK